MKSSKEMIKLKKISKANKNATNKIINIIKSFTHDEISEKANDIYLQRIERGEHGTAEQDWINAEKLLNEIED